MIYKHPLAEKLEKYDWKELQEEAWPSEKEEELPDEGFLVDGVYFKTLKDASDNLGYSYTTIYNWWHRKSGPLKIQKL